MAEHTALKKALRQMAEGSKSAFHTFYTGTSQYIYSSALLLYDSHEDACRFMVDFYQYLYLHLPEYDRSKNLEDWISRLLLERYEQLSIRKDLPEPSLRQQMNSGAARLSKSEQERVWRMLDVQIHFPKETVHRSPLLPILLISALLLLLLFAGRYLPAAMEQLQSIQSATPSEDPSGNDEVTDELEPSGSENAQEDEPDSVSDELNDLLNERANTGADHSADDADDLLQQQQSQHADTSGQIKTPESPAEPDQPQMPQAPEVPQEPSLSDDSSDFDTLSDIEDLENLELELRYGDSLRF